MKSYDIAKQPNFYEILDSVSKEFEKNAFRKLEEPARLLTDAKEDPPEEWMLYLLIFYVCVEEKRGDMSVTQYLNFMKECGEYKEIVPLLERFLLQFQNSQYRNALLPISKEVCDEMYRLGETNFSQVFACTDSFANQVRTTEPTRKDIEFVARKKQEYYLNLFGAQILNHLYEDDFRKTEQKFIFLPSCMAAAGEHCQATDSCLGQLCADCTDTCPIHQIKMKAETKNASVRVFSHSSQIHALDLSKKDSYGLIGIACLPNLLEGGFQARRLGFIPQCVFLNFGGCKHHWDSQGILTNCDVVPIIDKLSY